MTHIKRTFKFYCKYSWKKTVKQAVEQKNTSELKLKIEQYSKLDEMKKETKCEMKPYLKELTMKDARMKYRLRAKMFDCKINMPSDIKNSSSLWKCDSCMSNIDTQTERGQENDLDILKYEVMNIGNHNMHKN